MNFLRKLGKCFSHDLTDNLSLSVQICCQEEVKKENDSNCKAFCVACKHKKKTKTKNLSQIRCLFSEPISSLTQNQNKEKELFLKIASSRTFFCNVSWKQELQRVRWPWPQTFTHRSSHRAVFYENICMFNNKQFIKSYKVTLSKVLAQTVKTGHQIHSVVSQM